MGNSNNLLATGSDDFNKGKKLGQVEGDINGNHAIVHGPDTLEELNTQLHQVKLDKWNELLKRCLKWR